MCEAYPTGALYPGVDSANTTTRRPKRTNVMSPQRSSFRPSISPLPKRIAFVLPGRITLSEHLPAEVIDVTTSVARRSKYLHKVIQQHAITNSTDSQIRLPNIDSIGFRMYIDWLKSGDIQLGTTSIMSKGGLLLRDSFDYIFAHITGSQLEDSDFQDFVIDTMTRLLDASQTPQLKVLERVFLEEDASNILKQFVVDMMFAVERRMLAKMRGVVDNPENKAQSDAGCKYHVHAKGECYRNNTNSGYGRTANISESAHQEYDLRNINGLGSQSRWSSSSTSLDSESSTRAAFYSMTDKQYFGSEEWPREVHGLSRNERTSQLRTDKPLPTVPPLTPGTSPTPASPLDSLQIPPHLLSDRSYHESLNKEFIHECLSRLPPGKLPNRRLGDLPESQKAVIPSLVLECMERYQNAALDNAPSYSSCSPDRSSSNPPRTLIPIPEQERLPLPCLEPSQPDAHGHWQKSFGLLPNPWQTQVEQYHNVIELDASKDGCPTTAHRPFIPPPIHVLQDFPPYLIKRKPAPPRGSDWLEQYDCINAMMGKDIPVISAKRNKESRSKEMLRSDTVKRV
jgi:hypothetical protein